MQPQVLNTTDVALEAWDDPARGNVSFRVLFSADRTSTSELYTGLAELSPAGWMGRHRHAAAEVYHVIEGSGVIFLEGAEHSVAAGSAVFIPGNAEHGMRNTGEGVLRVLYTFPTDSFEDVVYHFSDDE